MTATYAFLFGAVMLPIGLWSMARGVRALVTGTLPAEEARWREKYSEKHGDDWIRPLYYATVSKYCICGLTFAFGGAMSIYLGVMLWFDPSFLVHASGN